MKVDLTVLAIPAYVGSMGAEYLWQRRHPVPAGTRAGDHRIQPARDQRDGDTVLSHAKDG